MNPAPHVSRPRLTDQLRDHRIVLLEGGGGAGKTSLAMELADVCDLAPVHLRLDAHTATGRVVAARAAEALQRLGHTRAATVAAGADEPETLAAAFTSIDAPALVVLDDLHHLDDGLVASLNQFVDHLPEPHRLVLSTRRVPPGLEEGGVRLDHQDLALTLDEATTLARLLGVAEPDAAEVAAAVLVATDGWVAPTIAALNVLEHPDHLDSAWHSVRQIVERILSRVTTADRKLLAGIAGLPRLHDAVIAALDAEDALAAAQKAGVPIRQLGGGWFVLANPFNETLARSGQLGEEALQSACRALANKGEILLAADLLRRESGDVAVARLLSEVPLDEVLRTHGGELLGLLAALDDDALAAHPRALLTGSLVAFLVGQPEVRRALVDRLQHLTVGTSNERLATAEDLLERIWRHPDDHGQLAERARSLEKTDGDDPELVARTAEVQARALAFDTAEPSPMYAAWDRCIHAWDAAGYRTQAARAEIWSAVIVGWANGHYDRALELIDRALARAGSTPSIRLLALVYRGMVLVDLGRYDEADATFRRGRALAVALRADVRRAHIAWFTARMASQQGDPEATLAAVLQAEAADVTDAAGGAFFAADAATLLARVDCQDEAETRLAYALDHDPGSSEKIPVAAMDVAARRGDLSTALRWFDQAQRCGPLEPRETWRYRLLLAWAAHRSDDDRAPVWAAEAFDGVGALGLPQLAFVREPAISRTLVEVAAEAGSQTAARLLDQGFATIAVLGEFGVDLPGAPRIVPTGTQAQALKFIAVNGGRVPQSALIECLWPNVAPARGRQRLRVVLSRLKREVGDLVLREGETVVLAKGVTVDATRFDDLAQRALIEQDLGLAEAAVAAYHGPLLPDDPYEEWAATERDRLAWRYLALLDRLAAAAEDAGDLERALSLLYVGMDEEPEVEDRYLRAARLLCEQSRHSRARALLERAERLLEAHDLRPSHDLLHLLERLRT